MSGTARIALACEAPARLDEVPRLAAQLALPLAEGADSPDYLLVLTDQRLELRSLGPGAPGPIFVDFVGGRVAHRHRFGGGRGQPLARAVGLKPGYDPTVIDATAGMGRDAFVLATLGCRVHMLERSPVIAALLADGLARATADAELGPVISGHLRLVHTDAIAYLRGLTAEERPEVVYLDPMYPHRRKAALVKKEMRTFRTLVGEDPDAGELLLAALEAARKRVVVKRPKGAEPLPGPRPNAAVESPNTRYDLYVIAARG